MTKAQIQEYYEQYLKYLKDNNLEIEFGRIHFIKKDKTTEELEKFENPKREYLKSLLEIDSKKSKLNKQKDSELFIIKIKDIFKNILGGERL